MILRPLERPPSSDQEWAPAWPVVERLQRQKCESCWMITQPSHAALAGEIAARLQGPQVPKLDADLVRAIALHDTGWGLPDAQIITRNRSAPHQAPKSFLDTEVAEFLDAWTQSIQVVQSVGPAGGYIVSRHFQRLAEHRIAAAGDDARDRKRLQEFVAHETQRQQRLAARQARTSEELELMTDVLQFCDLLSLYICAGATDNAEFPKYFGVTARVRVEAESYRLEPDLVASGSRFRVAALRHPVTKEESAREIQISIE